jgi:hypothetical protein
MGERKPPICWASRLYHSIAWCAADYYDPAALCGDRCLRNESYFAFWRTPNESASRCEMTTRPPEMLTPEWRRWEEFVQNRSSRRPRFARDPLHSEYVEIVNQTRALLLALVELSLEPTSAAKSLHLKVTGRDLKRRCNRLVHKLLRRPRVHDAE